ncbi:MAG: tetratricopeptide repeat protein, partial [Thermodesulfobacteriota bacterium]
LPSLHNSFVNWDDDVYIYENRGIQSLDAGFLKWAFTTVVGSNWHPLTLLSHGLDYAVWGLEPWGHHLTNTLFHTCNTALVFILTFWLVKQGMSIRSSTAGLNKAALIAGVVTALLFGIHPLHVESVAWASERKDLLCAFFFLLSILAYLFYASSTYSRKIIPYVAALALFTMALLSKPMAVTLPLVLLLLDIYPLERLPGKGTPGITRGVMVEKAPFLALSLLSSLATIWAQRTGGALATFDVYPLPSRILVALRAYMFYLYKMVLPLNLAPLYPYPEKIELLSLEYLGSLLLLTVLTLASIITFRRYKYISAAWFYYIVTLLPVIGIVQVGIQAAADRYTYLPSLGPFILFGVVIGFITERHSRIHTLLISASLALMFIFWGISTRHQIALWKDSMTLWSHEINLFPERAYSAYTNRGNSYFDEGNYKLAIEDFNKSIAINPQYEKAYSNRGNIYYRLGNNRQALLDFNTALELDPQYEHGYYNRGTLYLSSGNYRQAIKDFSSVIDLNPQYATAYNNRGSAYHSLGDYHLAIKDFDKAIELNPYPAEFHYNRGVVYISMENHQQAIENLNKALELNPQYFDAYYNRGIAFYNLGNHQKAIEDLNKALEINPRDAETYYSLSLIYSHLGKTELSRINYRKAVRLGFKE